MEPTYRWKPVFIFLLSLTALTINSCKKDLIYRDAVDAPLTIARAKDYFEREILSKSDGKGTAVSGESPLRSILKITKWDKAKVKKISLGNAVKVSLAYDPEVYVITDKAAKKGINLEKLSYLMIYKDKQKT